VSATGASEPLANLADGVLIVNLDDRPERWANAVHVLSDLIPVNRLTRLRAVLGAALPGYGEPPWFRGRRRDRTWAGRAGCTLSHRQAIAQARQAGWRSVLIFEDDIELSDAAMAVARDLPEQLDRVAWDVCYLGYTDPVSPFRTVADLDASHSLVEVGGCSTTHAYLLRDSTFDWLLERLPEQDRIWPWISRHRAIDRWYYRNLASRFRVLAVSPSIVNQQGGFSDITLREHELVHATEVPTFRTGPIGFAVGRWLRRLRWALAGPRDWLRGRIKRLRGF
jgi:hypothetical protein